MEELSTDVLVIGGGVAGLNAALAVREAGLDVIVTDKGAVARSGCAGGGIDHFMAYLETGEPWDSRQAYLEYVGRTSWGAVDLAVHEAIFCDELWPALQRFREWGVPLEEEDGSYMRTKSFGQPGPYWINFNGKQFKPRLARAARQSGAKMLDRVSTVDLLVHDGRVFGAYGFHIRRDKFYVIRARAVILATGGTNRIYENPSGWRYNTWLCPVNTGDAQAMAYRAGAGLANVEYMRITLVPKNFSAAGLNALMGMGCRMVNALGEEFMERYDPAGIKAPRYKLVEGILGEMQAGRGPVYIDASSLPEDELRHLSTTLAYDKETYPDYLHQKGLDLRKDLLEIGVSEGMQGGPTEVCGSGVKIDASCRTELEGLYAAGNCADQARSFHMAVTSGYHAGKEAAKEILDSPRTALPEAWDAVEKEKQALQPLGRKAPYRPIELEQAIARVVSENLGAVRNERGLSTALAKLQSMKEVVEGEMTAQNRHELRILYEVINMRTMGEAMAAAALFRRESRFGIGHFRVDYPETDDEHWLGQVVVKKPSDGSGQAPRTEFRPLSYAPYL
ncbi:MAG: FAD-binding protein [Actinobacteria bacterium]|jgi:adenylylsulfate reductase subunit A|nr:FAD-binding protein [Actinomycetota bacterium]